MLCFNASIKSITGPGLCAGWGAVGPSVCRLPEAKNAESHPTSLMDKLSIHETAGLVRYAIRIGLIRP
jgi:hypothetical protein